MKSAILVKMYYGIHNYHKVAKYAELTFINKSEARCGMLFEISSS